MQSGNPLASTCSVCDRPIDYGERFTAALSFPLAVDNTSTFQNLVVASPALPKPETTTHAKCLNPAYGDFGKLPDVTRARTETYVCPNCNKHIKAGDRVFLNLISLGKNPGDISGNTLEIGMEFEYIHADCKNPGLYPVPRRKAHRDDLSPHLVDRDTRCTRCRKPFELGDRLVPVMIARGKMHDPTNPAVPGLELMENFELMHAACANPRLERRVSREKTKARFPGDIQSFHGS